MIQFLHGDSFSRQTLNWTNKREADVQRGRRAIERKGDY
jgi:hypothetical protein